MRGRLPLRGRLLASHLVVVLVGTVTLFSTVGLVAPGAFDAQFNLKGFPTPRYHDAIGYLSGLGKIDNYCELTIVCGAKKS